LTVDNRDVAFGSFGGHNESGELGRADSHRRLDSQQRRSLVLGNQSRVQVPEPHRPHDYVVARMDDRDRCGPAVNLLATHRCWNCP
jgi:hypothetical protein